MKNYYKKPNISHCVTESFTKVAHHQVAFFFNFPNIIWIVQVFVTTALIAH